MQQALHWLLEHQEKNGAWGHWREPEQGSWTNPETQLSWQVAVTGIGNIAMSDLLERSFRSNQKPEKKIIQAWERSLQYLVVHSDVRRPSDWDTDHTWALVYGLAALTRAAQHNAWNVPLEPKLQKKIEKMGAQLIERLWKYQTGLGGWAYYADETHAARPHWTTSFQTAIAVLGLLDAKALGWEVKEDRLALAVEAVRRSRLPNGAYSYSVELYPTPGGLDDIDQTKGSLSRIQVCNLALFRAAEAGIGVQNKPQITQEDLSEGMRLFFKEHKFLDAASGRPIPHEAWYANSGYFYFFGHYYAAGVLNLLPPDQRAHFRPALWKETLKQQAKDGSLIDFKMNSHGRPYGTAYALSALARTIPVRPKAPASGQNL
jgi:hypothetical protein